MGLEQTVLQIAGAAAVVLGSLVVSAVATGLGVLIALGRFRRSAGRPWPERAAAAFAARSVLSLTALLHILAVGGLVLVRIAPALGLPRQSLGALSGLSAFLGSLAVGQFLERRLCQAGAVACAGAPECRLVPRGPALFWLISFPLVAIFLVMAAFIPTRWGWGAGLILAGGALVVAFYMAGGMLAALFQLGWLRPASPRLQGIVAETAARLGIQPRATYELRSPQANALAWFLPRYVMFTSPACAILDDAELAAITAHELGHLAEPWGVFLLRVVAPFLLVALAAGIPLAASYGPWAGLAPVAFYVLVLGVLGRVGRRMEERSDRLARSIEREGESAGAYAQALEKLYAANLLPVVNRGKRHVHPHLYDRMVAAGVPPEYSRPAPPRGHLFATLPTLVLIVVCLWEAMPEPVAAERELVMVGSESIHEAAEAAALARQADQAERDGDLEAAVGLYECAVQLDPRASRHAANLARLLVKLGRYDAAETALEQAERTLSAWDDDDPATRHLIERVRELLLLHLVVHPVERWRREPGPNGSPLHSHP